jgi:hypothetical protein
MKKLILLLVLLTTASYGADYHSPYDPGAARNTLSNVTPATGRAALGLGTISTVNSPVPVANGGTGKTTAAEALAALGGASLNGSSTVNFTAKNASFTGDIDVAGKVKATTGTAAAPAYSFVSDPDTGVYHSAANTLAFSAGGEQGLLVGVDGVGIGVAPGASYELELMSTNRQGAMRIKNASSRLEANATQYRTGALIDMVTQSIATGVTNAGYVRGLAIDSYMDSDTFEGTLATLRGAYIRTGINKGTGTVTNCYALHLINLNSTGTITNNWGLYQEGATARNYFAGRTLIGASTTDDTVNQLQVDGNIKAVVPTYADNAAAIAGGLVVGAFYRTSTGVLMIRY